MLFLTHPPFPVLARELSVVAFCPRLISGVHAVQPSHPRNLAQQPRIGSCALIVSATISVLVARWSGPIRAQLRGLPATRLLFVQRHSTETDRPDRGEPRSHETGCEPPANRHRALPRALLLGSRFVQPPRAKGTPRRAIIADRSQPVESALEAEEMPRLNLRSIAQAPLHPRVESRLSAPA